MAKKVLKKITFELPPLYILEDKLVKKIFTTPKEKRIIKK